MKKNFKRCKTDRHFNLGEGIMRWAEIKMEGRVSQNVPSSIVFFIGNSVL